MTSRHPRFVTFCQQTLVLGVICAGLTPAANILALELVPDGPSGPSATPAPPAGYGELAAYERANAKPSEVPTAPVDAKVKEYSLTAPTGARMAPGALKADSRRMAGGASKVLSEPQPVNGYGAVGVTWEHGLQVPDDQISVKVRTYNASDRSGGYTAGWSKWMPVDYHDDHGPDPDSAEAKHARPGTDELLVGDVDQVQVKIATDDAAPADLKLAVIDPGTAKRSAKELPAIDTGELASAEQGARPAVDATPRSDVETGTGDDLDLAAAKFTPKPVIYSRAQWGANENLRDKGSLHYYEVHAGFVHHTVNANNYTRNEVPGILRGIYAYHTQSRGWSDVGYNYLVDRFGRIWEGRAGGVDRPVVGAHTLGYNDDSFAMSAIGNYDITQPSQKMIQAYAALFAWKLSLHGVDAASKKQFVTSRNFQAINGHRDAGQTACPGKYLYAKIPEIRRLAARLQVGFSGRQLESDIASTPLPDLIARRTKDQHIVTVPIVTRADGTYKTQKPIDSGLAIPGATRILNAGDWDRDGHADMITRSKSGNLYLWPGKGNGKFGPNTKLTSAVKKVGLLAAVGDVTGDGWPDLMGQPKGRGMMIYPGRGAKGVKAPYAAYSRINASRQIGVGLWTKDGAPDSMFKNGDKLSLIAGNGPGGLTGRAKTFGMDLSGISWVVGISPVDNSGRPAVVMRPKADGKLYLVQATGARNLSRPKLIGRGYAGYDLVD